MVILFICHIHIRHTSQNCVNMSRQRAIATRRHLFSYIDTEQQNELLKIVQSLLVPGKGILGCHNISKYLFQYLPDSKIKNDKSNRNKFRQLLVTTKGLCE